MMANDMELLCVKMLFSDEKYLIPIYQRNYAWGEQELVQLIQDIFDYSDKGQDYYIGTLVVYEKKSGGSIVYEIIDGQQRLTALTIILDVIKNEFRNDYDINAWYRVTNLDFKSRKISTNTLQILFESPENIDGIDYNSDIKAAYDSTLKFLRNISKDKQLSFFNYLLNNVYILRVPVPSDTDLNHYFEIMNTRGEQLEKHEIVKSLLVEVLSEDPNGKILSSAFDAVWEACSNMERYIQYGFAVDHRLKIFGENWDTLICYNFDGISNIIASSNALVRDNTGCQKLDEIIISSPENQNFGDKTPETPERFNSIISFSNFLLHVLKIQEKNTNIALDDKQLIDMFKLILKNKTRSQQVDFVKNFGYNLLKCKFLFDQYIIKRDLNKDHWSLLRLKNINNSASYVNTFGSDDDESVNRDMLMLLSMFHVSFPTQIYKYWLYAALSYLYKNDAIIHGNNAIYKNYLKSLAEAFLLDRFLAINPVDYNDIIFKNDGIPKNTLLDIDKTKLDKGAFVENFIFNYLDYLLWDKDKSKYSSFEFTFRSSVEHYYPRHPMEGFPVLEEIILDNFGNLCLISSSRNSRLSNYMPQAKKEHYRANSSVESIKQQIMMEYEKWGEDEVLEHGAAMKNILPVTTCE
jgi:hypothetical protein